MGINRMFADSGYFLGSIVAGSLLDHFGFKIPLYFIAGYAGVVLILTGFSIHNKAVNRG